MRIPPPTGSRSRTKWALWLGSHNSTTVPQIAHAAGKWLRVPSASRGALRHTPLAPGCLPGLRPDGVAGSDDGATCGEPDCVLLPLTRPAPPPGGPKGPSDDGGREELVEFCARRSACSIASACSRQVSSTSAAGSSVSKKARSMPARLTGGFLLIASTVNQIGAPAATP